MLETKAILNFLWYFLGLPVVIIGWLANMESWKSAVLFVLSVFILMVKAYFMIKENIHKHRKREMELEQQRFELDRQKRDYPI